PGTPGSRDAAHPGGGRGHDPADAGDGGRSPVADRMGRGRARRDPGLRRGAARNPRALAGRAAGGGVEAPAGIGVSMRSGSPGLAPRMRRLRSLTIASAQYGCAVSHFAGALARRPRATRARPGPTWPVGAETSSRLAVRWPAAYGWPLAGHWVEGLRAGLASLVPVGVGEIEQPYEGTVLIEVTLDGVRHEVAIDYFDRSRVLDEVAARCPLVFK